MNDVGDDVFGLLELGLGRERNVPLFEPPKANAVPDSPTHLMGLNANVMAVAAQNDSDGGLAGVISRRKRLRFMINQTFSD